MENLNIIFLRTWRRKSQAILKRVKSLKALKACKSITNEKERERGEQNLEKKKSSRFQRQAQEGNSPNRCMKKIVCGWGEGKSTKHIANVSN